MNRMLALKKQVEAEEQLLIDLSSSDLESELLIQDTVYTERHANKGREDKDKGQTKEGKEVPLFTLWINMKKSRTGSPYTHEEVLEEQNEVRNLQVSPQRVLLR
ncbi:hypothetical protein CEXT_344151 [Caerostris extrusa]|uniref:Uncharacterized protein n=1 Tax=Caerostris extrusa TaxID=172846 RepID=A0AAV4P4I1_CAEEX|nr:hypothetical protein CEXT_344151 [Caerostris extrusa]